MVRSHPLYPLSYRRATRSSGAANLDGSFATALRERTTRLSAAPVRRSIGGEIATEARGSPATCARRTSPRAAHQRLCAELGSTTRPRPQDPPVRLAPLLVGDRSIREIASVTEPERQGAIRRPGITARRRVVRYLVNATRRPGRRAIRHERAAEVSLVPPAPLSRPPPHVQRPARQGRRWRADRLGRPTQRGPRPRAR